MNHTALIEAMARAMYEAGEGPWGDALMKEMRRYAAAALEAVAPAIRAEGRREGLEEAAMVADAARSSWHEKVRELEREYLELARERYAVLAAAEIAIDIRAMAEKGPTDEPR